MSSLSSNLFALATLALTSLFAHQLLQITTTPPNHQVSDILFIYYPIQGETFAELRQEMRNKGPRDQNQASCYAYTKWHLSWQYHRQDKSLPIEKYVQLKTTIILPNWRSSDSAPRELQIRWKHFYNALLSHELGHAIRAEKAKKNLSVRVRNADSPKAAQTVAKSITNNLLASDHLYDQRTHHGLSQKAFLH